MPDEPEEVPPDPDSQEPQPKPPHGLFGMDPAAQRLALVILISGFSFCLAMGIILILLYLL